MKNLSNMKNQSVTKIFFIQLKIFDSMHTLWPQTRLLNRAQDTLSHLFDIKGTNSIMHNFLYKANYRWCDASMKSRFVYFTWTPCWRVPLSPLLYNQWASEFLAIFLLFSCKPISFQFQFSITTLPDEETLRVKKIAIFLSGKFDEKCLHYVRYNLSQAVWSI